jgi:hypothetical protein
MTRMTKSSRSGKAHAKASTPLTWDTIREMAMKLPGVEEGTSYGTPALRVKKKFLARLREDGQSVAFRIGFDVRDILMQAKPETFYITDHYRGYPAVLLRLSTATRQEAADVLQMAWRFVAPKRLLARFNGTTSTSPST